jgi:hypothetical protein
MSAKMTEANVGINESGLDQYMKASAAWRHVSAWHQLSSSVQYQLLA